MYNMARTDTSRTLELENAKLWQVLKIWVYSLMFQYIDKTLITNSAGPQLEVKENSYKYRLNSLVKDWGTVS